MAVQVTCPDHPEADVTYPGDLILHAATAHPGETVLAVSDRCVVTRGNSRLPNRIFYCRVCAVRVECNDNRLPYCDEHQASADV